MTFRGLIQLAAISGIVGFLQTAPCRGDVMEWLTNGDFEDLSGIYPAGWTLGATGGPPGMTTGLAGTANAAVMFGDSAFGSSLTQSNLDAGPEWIFDLYFAAAQPPDVEGRSLNFILNSGTGGVINMRVNGDGDVQAFSGTWQSLIPAGVTFSIDNSFDGDFDDVSDVANVHRLRLVGDFTTTPSYEVMLSGANSDTFSMTSGQVAVFDGTPQPNSGVASVSLRSLASTASYVVDKVSLMAEQAPVLPYSGLINGDFEDLSGTFPTNWTIVRPAITQHAGLDGTATGLFLKKSTGGGLDGGGRVSQTLAVPPGPEWELDLLFATEDPGDANARGFNLILNSSPNNGNLNLRVNGDGSVQTVTTGGTWIDIPNLTNAVSFSVDGNVDGDFSDTEDTLNVHRLVLRGDYTTATPEYTVFISAANSTELTLSGTASRWFSNAPAAGASIGTVIISAQSSAGSFLVDEMVLRKLGTVPGDYNGDGLVDAADYVLWRDTKGSMVDAGTGADGDGSGTVDEGDYQFWVNNFGTSGGSGAASGLGTNVPEPAAILLMVAGVVTLIPLVRRRSNKKSVH